MEQHGQISCAYQVMTFVNDPDRGEPVNIGVILYSPVPGGYKGCLFLTEEQIKKKCYQAILALDLFILGAIINEIQNRSRDHGVDSLIGLMQKSPMTRFKIQFTDPRGLLTEDPRAKLNWLFETYVALPE